MTVANTGFKQAESVVLNNEFNIDFAGGANLVSMSPNCNTVTGTSAQNIVCDLGSIPASGNASISITLTADVSGSLEEGNSIDYDGSVALDGADPYIYDNQVHEDTTVATVNLLARLNVAVQGMGNVTSNPGTIDCHPQCLEYFVPGTNVILTATPDANWVFVRWETACPGSTDLSCALAVTGDQNARAIFRRK
jgi:hypothetical protein